VKDLIASFPKGMHPMTQFSMAIMGCQTESEFAQVSFRAQFEVYHLFAQYIRGVSHSGSNGCIACLAYKLGILRIGIS
jgi:hypothetical protein